jgi:hypothetical protein
MPPHGVTFLQQAVEIDGRLGSLKRLRTFPILDAARLRHQLLRWTIGAVLCAQRVMAKGGTLMKKLALSMAAVLALLSIAGCAQYVGKGKAPPPVVTKG